MKIMLEVDDADLRRMGSLCREGIIGRESLVNTGSLEDALPLLLSVRKTAELLSISRSLCYELVRSGQIPSVRLASSIRVPTEGLKLFVQSLPE